MSVLHVCSTIQSDWKDLLTVDANQNFQWLKFLIIMCFTTWNYSSQKLDLEHTRAETSNIKTHILLIVMLPHSFQVLLIELNSQTLKTIIMQGYQGSHLYIPWWSKALSFHVLQMIGLCTSEKSGQGCLRGLLQYLSKYSPVFWKYSCFLKFCLFGLTPVKARPARLKHRLGHFYKLWFAVTFSSNH